MSRMIKRKGIQNKKRLEYRKSKKENRNQLFHWPKSADNFVRKLKEFGYIGDDEGVCHGVACVAAHEMLQNTVNRFDQDLQLISCSSVGDTHHQPIQRALLESVELCHHPAKYRHLFVSDVKRSIVFPPQNALKSLAFVESTTLSDQGGVVVSAKFSGVYGIAELIVCLKSIRAGLEKFPHLSVMLLSDESHIIAVQYHVLTKEWIFVDLRSLPSQRLIQESEVAVEIANALATRSKKTTVMSCITLVTKDNHQQSMKAFSHTTKLAEWKKIESVQQEKKYYFKKWLFVSAYDGCEKEVALLLSHHVDPNRVVIDEDTPLGVASRQGHDKVVKMLLEKGARVNTRRHATPSPLFSAMRAGNDRVVKLLRARDAKLKTGEYAKLVLPSD